MKTVSIRNRVVAIFGGVALFALAPQFALAMDADLAKAVAHGKDLYYHSTFGGNGKTCESCHSDGGMKPGKLPNGKVIPSLANAAAIFPHIRGRDHKLVTLPDQVHSCIAGGLKGTPPDYGSDDLNSVVAYITSLANGKKIEMGGKPK